MFKTERKQKMRTRRILTAILFVGIVLTSPVAFADTVYVSASGSDTTGDGSQGNPFATIGHANTDAGATARTILLNSGDTFNEAVTFSLAASRSVGVYGTGAAPVWTPGDDGGGTRKDVVTLASTSSLAVVGVTFAQYSGQGYDAVVVTGGGTFIGNNLKLNSATIGVETSNGKVSLSNTVMDDSYFGVLLKDASDHVISNCTFSNSRNKGITLTSSGGYGTVSITGNIFYNSSSYGVSQDRNDAGLAGDVLVEHNTFYEMSRCVNDAQASSASVLDVTNNIFADSTYGIVGGASGYPVGSDYDLFNGNTVDTLRATATNSVLSDPLFLSTTEGNENFLKINNSSPAATGGEGGTYIGAYAPIPEPATMSLLFIGGSAMMFYRKKK